MCHRFARSYYRLPVRRVTEDEKKIDNLYTVGAGELAYPDANGNTVARARRNAMTALDEEAEAEARAMRDLDRTDSNGVPQNRVRGK